jgi:hypothetical protein
MAFPEWSEALVAGVRCYLPDGPSSAEGLRHVIIRHGGREAHLCDDGSFWISFASGSVATTMASMFDDRRDDFTVGNIAKSIAGYFDARFRIVQHDARQGKHSGMVFLMDKSHDLGSHREAVPHEPRSLCRRRRRSSFRFCAR